MLPMAKVKVTRKYQVTIPEEVREKTGLSIGDEVIVKNDEDKIVIERPMDIKKLAGSWDHVVSTEKFMEEVRQLWKTWKRG